MSIYSCLCTGDVCRAYGIGKFCLIYEHFTFAIDSCDFPSIEPPTIHLHHSNCPLCARCIMSLCICTKRAPTANSMRYSALYVANVSIVTIMAYTESMFDVVRVEFCSRGGNDVRASTRRILSKNIHSSIRCSENFAPQFSFFEAILHVHNVHRIFHLVRNEMRTRDDIFAAENEETFHLIASILPNG